MCERESDLFFWRKYGNDTRARDYERMNERKGRKGHTDSVLLREIILLDLTLGILLLLFCFALFCSHKGGLLGQLLLRCVCSRQRILVYGF